MSVGHFLGMTKYYGPSWLTYYSDGLEFTGDTALLQTLSAEQMNNLQIVHITSLSFPLDKSPVCGLVDFKTLCVRSVDEAKIVNSVIKNAKRVIGLYAHSSLYSTIFAGFTGEWETCFLTNFSPQRVYYDHFLDVRRMRRWVNRVSNKGKCLRLRDDCDEGDVLRVLFLMERQVSLIYRDTEFAANGILNREFKGHMPLIKTLVNLLLLQTGTGSAGVFWSKSKRQVLGNPDMQDLLKKMLFNF